MDDDRAVRLASLWDGCVYAPLGELLMPAAVELGEAIGEGKGRRVVDVAAGTGSTSRVLAALGWRVEAVDISPSMVEAGSAATAGTDVAWQVGAVEELPFADAGVDAVVSSFGLIFADPPRAGADEAARVLKPDGRLALTAWDPEGYMAEMTARVYRVVPPPTQSGLDPFAWGAPEVAELLGDGFTGVRRHRRTLPWAFGSAELGAAFLFDHSPAHRALVAAYPEQADDLRAAVHDHLADYADPDTGRVDIAVEYVVVTARRRAGSSR